MVVSLAKDIQVPSTALAISQLPEGLRLFHQNILEIHAFARSIDLLKNTIRGKDILYIPNDHPLARQIPPNFCKMHKISKIRVLPNFYDVQERIELYALMAVKMCKMVISAVEAVRARVKELESQLKPRPTNPHDLPD